MQEKQKQREWVAFFQKLIENKSDNEVFIFIDGVHPMHNTKSEYGWIQRGKDYEMPANSGRQRININGAINVLNPTEVFICEDSSINAQTNIALMKRLIQAYPGKTIRVFSDNARYNHAEIFTTWLAEYPQIKFDYIPAYSPNLNPIERLWKLLRKKTINSFYYETFSQFRTAVINFFNNIHQYKEELASLITLNFELRGDFSKTTFG